MQNSGVLKHVVGSLILAVAIYAGGYSLDQHLRSRRGPWQVTFATEPDGAPAIILDQPRLDVSNVKIVFAGETMTNAPGTVRFDIPRRPVPVGKVKFEDLTYLPGTVTLELFGHEIELLPRTLFINRKEHPWKSNETIRLTTADKPASLPEPKPKKRY